MKQVQRDVVGGRRQEVSAEHDEAETLHRTRARPGSRRRGPIRHADRYRMKFLDIRSVRYGIDRDGSYPRPGHYGGQGLGVIESTHDIRRESTAMCLRLSPAGK